MNNRINRQLFIDAINRLRIQNFGAETLKLFETTPETGEQLIIEMPVDWSARRVSSASDSAAESGFWQIQIVANNDWETSHAFMKRVATLAIGDRRFVVRKLEKPIGNARVWKLRAEIQ